jgi:hypothetical protein
VGFGVLDNPADFAELNNKLWGIFRNPCEE